MKPTEPVFNPLVLETLKGVKDLPSMPAVALQVLRVAQDENSGAEDLAAVVSLDPVLAARILKAANSALFCASGEVTTLRRACSRMGFRTVKLMALSLSLVDSFERPALGRFDYDEFWKRSVVRGVSARLLAEAGARSLADEAFMIGLLSHIGQLLLACCLPDKYEAVLVACKDGWPSQDLEKRELGFASIELGAALLHSWKLPSLIYEAMLQSRDLPESDDDSTLPNRKLARVLHLASLCEEFTSGPAKSKTLSELHRLAGKMFSLDKPKIEELLGQLEQRTTEIAESLSIDVEGGLQITSILREAQEEVLQETLALLHSAVATERRASELEREKSHLLVKAQTDPLTGLANRSTFDEYLEGCLGSGQNRLPVGLLMIDVDHFKSVNDQYGHPVGDDVLRTVGRVIQEVTRQSDLAARYGGEEFSIIMARTPMEALKKVAERVRVQIESQKFEAASGSFNVSVSIGGAHTDLIDEIPRPQTLIETADQHLYAAKRAGRNRCTFPQPPVDAESSVAKSS